MQNLPRRFDIPQDGYKKFKIIIDAKNAILLSNIRFWYQNEKSKSIYNDGKKYIRVNYMYMINSLPILKIRNKNTLTVRFKQLENDELIERFQAKDNTLYVRITSLSEAIYEYQNDEGTVHSNQDSLSTETKTGCPPRDRQHNKNKYKKNKYSFKKNNLGNSVGNLKNGYDIHIDEKELTNKLGLVTKKIKKAKPEAEVDPNQRRKADHDLEYIRTKNHRERPEVYET